jgi:hypothetical protein
VSHQHHHIVASRYFKNPAGALIDCVRQAKKQQSTDKQVVHIVFVNLILAASQWQAITSVTSVDDIDGDGKPAIIFGHLPAKYEGHYDDLLPEVDHLNIIDNVSVWRDIKKHMLDVHFYQAVHFGEIQRISETGGGYFKEKKDKFKSKNDYIFDFDDQTKTDTQLVLDAEHIAFQEAVEIQNLDRTQKEYEILLRNQREGRMFKNLVIK